MHSVRAMIARLATNLLAVCCLIAGFTLMTVAGGMVLARLYSPEFALLVTGLGWLGAGLVLLSIGGSQRPAPRPAQPDLASAFLRGYGAGSATRRGFEHARSNRH